MPKVPFELVSIESDKILNKILETKDHDEANDLYQQYFDFLKKCGWTEEEFDKATLEFVDKSWKNPPSLSKWIDGPAGQKMELKYDSPVNKKN